VSVVDRLVLRPLVQGDLHDALRLKEQAGWNQTAEDWQRFLDFSPNGCLAAVLPDHGLVGTAATITYGGAVAWISMVLVDRHHQGAGIGGALLDAALAALAAAGVPTVKLDATPQGRPLYQKKGFVVEREIERWVLQREGGIPRPVGAPASSQPPLDDVALLDREAFGTDRRGLLESVAGSAPDLVLRVPGRGASGGLRGFALGRHGALADHLGPVAARDEAAAAWLVDEFLRRSRRSEVVVDRVCTQPWARELLASRGFTPQRTLTRMYRGTNAFPGTPEILCAIMGPEFG
jgi:GNAT superfamily N-acetyltransferase